MAIWRVWTICNYHGKRKSPRKCGQEIHPALQTFGEYCMSWFTSLPRTFDIRREEGGLRKFYNPYIWKLKGRQTYAATIHRYSVPSSSSTNSSSAWIEVNGPNARTPNSFYPSKQRILTLLSTSSAWVEFPRNVNARPYSPVKHEDCDVTAPCVRPHVLFPFMIMNNYPPFICTCEGMHILIMLSSVLRKQTVAVSMFHRMDHIR